MHSLKKSFGALKSKPKQRAMSPAFKSFFRNCSPWWAKPEHELKEASRQGIKRSADANTVIDGVIDGALDGVRGLTTGALKQSGLITCFEVVK